MLYELASLSCPLLELGAAAEGAAAWVGDPKAGGTLLGLWRSELGLLGRVVVLRGFEAPEALSAERRRALTSRDPFDGAGTVTALEMEGHAPFAFLPPVATGRRGGVYELRTYRLRPGGLAPTLDAWEAALRQDAEPARAYTRHLVTALYALDGAPRISHLWAFDDLEQRGRLRAAAYAAGVWPPKGAPEQILEATASILLPLAGSPLG